MAVVERTLERTPTWAVATVCFILLMVSIFIEHILHLIGKYFAKRKRGSLTKALDKIKSELMLLGFISLLLTASEKWIANICIPESISETFLPCATFHSSDAEDEAICEEGKVSLVSRKGVQQLQFLIFVLAVFHVFSCILTFGLGVAKMRKWESWEAETRTLDYRFSNDPRRFKLSHQTSFGKRHLRFWSQHRILRWPACFLRQFYKSVSKVDYFTLRHGFITAHIAEGSDFDFQKYIRRALENDFGVIVSSRWWLWIFSMCFLFFNANGFRNYYWLPFIPLVMVLVVGTKLQGIITKMSVDSNDKTQIVRGTFLVKPSDHFFWLARPRLLLHLMHFILFQNSFQLAFFTWTWYKFGLRSCFHEETEDIIIRMATGVAGQILCGYVTLPLYALVTQMGSSMRNTVFTDDIVKGLKKWRARAKKNLATRQIMKNTDPKEEHRAPEYASVGYSPSFGTLSTSISLDVDDSIAFEIVEEEEDQQISQHFPHKISSFNGFHLDKN